MSWSTKPSKPSQRPLEDLLLRAKWEAGMQLICLWPFEGKNTQASPGKTDLFFLLCLKECGGCGGGLVVAVVALWFGALEEVLGLLSLPLMKGLAIYHLRSPNHRFCFSCQRPLPYDPMVKTTCFLLFSPFMSLSWGLDWRRWGGLWWHPGK